MYPFDHPETYLILVSNNMFIGPNSDEDEMHCDEGFLSEPVSPGASQHATHMEAMIAQVETNDVSIRLP